MSQAKVDYHKEQKKNRKDTVKKERAISRVWAAVAVVIGIGFVGFVGYSLYDVISDAQKEAAAANIVPTEVDLSAITDYQSSLTSSADSSDAE